MYYVSTRNKEDRRTAAEAIAQGLAADGGLMTPEVFPKLSHNALDTMRDMSYQQRAVYVMNSYLDDFTASELSAYADKAYGGEKFDVKEVAPVWSCGTAPPVPSRTWPCRCCHTCSPPPW